MPTGSQVPGSDATRRARDRPEAESFGHRHPASRPGCRRHLASCDSKARLAPSRSSLAHLLSRPLGRR